MQKKIPKIKEVYTVSHARTRPGPAKSGPLRGADLRFVYGLYIFCMRFADDTPETSSTRRPCLDL